MTHALLAVDVIGFWIGIFLTFCVLSYLYKDNPFYKFAEHLFVGISIGYFVVKQYYDTIKPNLLLRLTEDGWFWYLIPLAMVLALFVKAVSTRLSWIGRYPLAFVVAFYAGLQVNAVGKSDLGEQIEASIQPIGVEKVDVNRADAAELAGLPGFSPSTAKLVAETRDQSGVKFGSLDEIARVPGLTDAQREDLLEARGPIAGLDAQASVAPDHINWYRSISRFLLLVGLLASLIYFYFSIEQKGAVRHVSRFGIWVLMVGFGAAFGLTVQGRLALAVGRAMDVLDKDKSARAADQINGPYVALICIVVIVVGIILWERWSKRRPPPKSPADEQALREDLPEY